MKSIVKDGRPAATLKRVSKRFGTLTALDQVDLEIEQGQVTSILGPNGAGKTTVVKLLLGVLRPSAGKVELFGGRPTSLSARVRTGAMMQISALPATQPTSASRHGNMSSTYRSSPRCACCSPRSLTGVTKTRPTARSKGP